MFRPSSSLFQFPKTTKKISQINPWPPTVPINNINNNRMSSKSFDKMVQSSTKNKKQKDNELVILVDTSSLLYRRAYTYLNERSYQQHLQKKQMSAKSKNKKIMAKSKENQGFEIDPTKWLHSNLAHSMKFIHSVIPFGDGDEEFQPDLISAEILEGGLKCGKVKHSGGLMKRGAKELAYLAKMSGNELPLVLQEDFSHNNNNNNNANNVMSDNGDKDTETTTSTSLLKRRIYFCFDHHGKSLKKDSSSSSSPIILDRRSEILSDYKGNRKQSECSRVISFVNYGGALIRQLLLSTSSSHQDQHQFVHACFPTQMKKVEPSNLTSHEIIEKLLPNKISDFILRKDPLLKSLFAAATSSSAFGIDECFYEKKTKSNYVIRGEADDAIYTLTKYFSELNHHNNNKQKNNDAPLYSVLVISGDKDLLQLLEFPNTYFFNLSNNKFISRSEACEKFSVSSPSQIADVLTLMGDAADNIRGLPETGQKRAAQIVKKYGSVENFVRQVHSSLENNRQYMLQKQMKKKQKLSKKKSNKNKKQKPVMATENNNEKNEIEYIPLLHEKEPQGYERTIFDHISRHGEQLVNIKKHVIELQELPWIRDSVVKEMKQTKNEKLTNFSCVPMSKYHSGFDFFSSSSSEVVLTPLSSKRISETFWSLIRKYYTKKIGVCNKNTESIHNCGVRERK